jgi:NADPH:quinone reductase-like Zn-dependent oxidoreductase
MRAAQFNKYGGPEVIEFNSGATLPEVKQGQVLVEGHAASLNPIDSVVRAGYMQAMVPLTFPVTLAGDFSGDVKEVGPGVSDLRIGDQVFGFAPVIVGGSGATADFIASNALMTALKPRGASHAEAAGLPLAGVSAVQALEDHLKVRSGQRILIHGGAGGVGSFAIQYAKYLGCYVATTVRGTQKEFVRKLGADSVVDFELEDFGAVLKEYDAVLDTVGGEVYRRSFAVLKKGGMVATMVQNPPDQEPMTKFGAGSVYVSAQLNTTAFNHLAELVDRGALKTQIGGVYPLERAREAFTFFEQDHPKGKVIVRIK